jgi:hypothetical protein
MILKINDDLRDRFPEFIKKKFRAKPGYYQWIYMFGCEEYKPIEIFAERFKEYQELT